MTDAERYHALKRWLLEHAIIKHLALPVGDTEPFVIGDRFYGETFEAAVDTIEK